MSKARTRHHSIPFGYQKNFTKSSKVYVLDIKSRKILDNKTNILNISVVNNQNNVRAENGDKDDHFEVFLADEVDVYIEEIDKVIKEESLDGISLEKIKCYFEFLYGRTTIRKNIESDDFLERYNRLIKGDLEEYPNHDLSQIINKIENDKLYKNAFRIQAQIIYTDFFSKFKDQNASDACLMINPFYETSPFLYTDIFNVGHFPISPKLSIGFFKSEKPEIKKCTLKTEKEVSFFNGILIKDARFAYSEIREYLESLLKENFV